jgi:membrane protease YdiL (CAAX protease family)
MESETATRLQSGWVHRGVLFVIFLICGLLIFVFGSSYYLIFPTNQNFIYSIGLTIFFLGVTAILSRLEGLKVYRPISYAFFIAATASFLSWILGPWLLPILDISESTLTGVGLAKLSEALVIVLTIIVLTKVVGDDLGSIYLKRGNLRFGLVIGLVTFIVLAVIAFLQAQSLSISVEAIVASLPWILTFIFANALMEELWFRGIFLKKFEPFLGSVLALILTSVVFTFAHIGATYTDGFGLLRFLALLFPLSLAWGYLMQKTDSIWGSVLFHAGADLLVIVPFIAVLG